MDDYYCYCYSYQEENKSLFNILIAIIKVCKDYCNGLLTGLPVPTLTFL